MVIIKETKGKRKDTLEPEKNNLTKNVHNSIWEMAV